MYIIYFIWQHVSTKYNDLQGRNTQFIKVPHCWPVALADYKNYETFLS